MSTAAATPEEGYARRIEFLKMAGAYTPGTDGTYMLEEAILAAREDGILFPRRLRDDIIATASDYFESAHEEGDDFYLDALDPWDAWQKFLAAPASDD